MAPKARVTLGDAEKHGHSQQDESQDSQLVTMYMHRLHGAGERSSSPLQPLNCDEVDYRINQGLVGKGPKSIKSKTVLPRGQLATVKNPAIAATVRAKDEVAPAGPANLNRPPPPPPIARAEDASNNRVIASSQPSSGHSTPIQITTDRLVCHGLSNAGSQLDADGSLHGALKTLHRPAHLRVEHYHGNEDDAVDSGRQYEAAASQPSTISDPRPYSRNHRRRKMELSQSPTQSNDGRSYEQYLPRGDDLIPSDGYELERLPDTQQSASTSANEGTTHDDDTGAVNFDFSAMGRRDTQVSYPDLYDTDRLQQSSPTAFIGLPETPAPPKNPFADSKASLMAASQMFRQTQTSSAFKTFSPTSSRPSPDNIHTLHSLPPHPVTSSPLKKATTISSPLLAQFPDVFDTSPQHETSELPFHDESQENEPPSASHGSEAGSDQDLVRKAPRRGQGVVKKVKTTERRLRPAVLQPPSNSDEIVPSTNREAMSDPAAVRLPEHGEDNPDRDSQKAIEDTQVGAQGSQQEDVQSLNVAPENADLRGKTLPQLSSNEAIVPNTASSPAASAQPPAPVILRPSPPPERPRVPESSSTHFRPRALGDMMPCSSEEASKAGSFTNLLGSSLPIDVKKGPQSREVTPEELCGLDSGIANSPLQSQAEIAETSPPVDSSPPPPAFSTRARLRGAQPGSSTNAPTSSPRPASLTSSLSRLGETPTLSEEATPATEESPQHRSVSSSVGELGSSPAVAKANRRKGAGVGAKSKRSRPDSIRALNLRSRRSLEADESTDELARSPSVSTPPVYQQNTGMPQYGRASLRTTSASRDSSRGVILFAGMAFAISFQSKQLGEKDSHYKSRVASSSQVANKIKQGGGKVLANGFDQLFEVTPVKNADREATSIASTPQPDEEISIAPPAQDTGFTALIADGHSRKVKYMQALALGLPCIHERWVTTCVEKQKLVDWSDYLLCAGNSAFLGDAIRSRSLVSYDATTAKLSQVIQHRPRLLDHSRILLIMSRAEEQKKMAYVFLARVLGASLSRVYTMDEARKQLKAREDAGHPYDWVYVEEKMASISDIFSSSSSTSTLTSNSRKRKRRNEAISAGPPPKKIRMLSDELVIQSLILGRLMDEDEMTV